MSDTCNPIVALQAPLSIEFSRKEYWSGLPFFSPGDLPDPGIEPVSAALQGILTAEPPGKPLVCLVGKNIHPVLCTSCRIYMIGWLGICLTVH